MEHFTTAQSILRPSILPPLIAFYVSPKITLASWLAVKSLVREETGVSALEEELCKYKRGRVLIPLGVAAGCGFFALIWTVSSRPVVDTVLLAAVGGSWEVSWFVFVATQLGAFEWAVFPGPGTGYYLWKPSPGTLKYSRMVLGFVLATALNAFTVYNPSGPLKLITTFVVLHCSVTAAESTLSVQGTIKHFALALLLACFAWDWIFVWFKNDYQHMELEGTEDEKRLCQLLIMFCKIVVAAVPGSWITLCYRLDYHFQPPITTPLHPPVPLKSLSAGAGIPLPEAFTISSFPQHFFIAAFTTWIFSAVFVSTCLSSNFLPSSINTDDFFEILTVALSLPLMIGSVLGMAAYKGIWEQVWNYDELWEVRDDEEKI